MQSANAQRVTIFIRQARGAPGYNELLAFLNDNGARNVFGIQPVDRAGDQAEDPVLRAVGGAIVYWIDSPGRVDRLLPAIGEAFADCLAVVDDIRLAFDTTTNLPDLSGKVRVSDVMTRDPTFVEPEAPVDDLIYLMVHRNLRGVPVVDAESHLVGIVTNTDLVSRAGLPARLELLRELEADVREATVRGFTRRDRPVAEIMTASVVSVTPETNIQEAARLMMERRLKRLPVVDSQNVLVGIVSRVDLLRSISTFGFQPAELSDHVEGARANTPIGDLMSRVFPEVGQDAPLSETLSAVISTRLNRAIVTDSAHRVVGIVSDSDLVDRLTPQARPGAISVMMHRLPRAHSREEFDETLRHTTGHRAQDLMRPAALVVHEDERLGAVITRILETESKAVPVVDADERLVGVIDRSHLLWAALDHRLG